MSLRHPVHMYACKMSDWRRGLFTHRCVCMYYMCLYVYVYVLHMFICIYVYIYVIHTFVLHVYICIHACKVCAGRKFAT